MGKIIFLIYRESALWRVRLLYFFKIYFADDTVTFTDQPYILPKKVFLKPGLNWGSYFIFYGGKYQSHNENEAHILKDGVKTYTLTHKSSVLKSRVPVERTLGERIFYRGHLGVPDQGLYTVMLVDRWSKKRKHFSIPVFVQFAGKNVYCM